MNTTAAKPANWDTLTIGEKSDWLGEHRQPETPPPTPTFPLGPPVTSASEASPEPGIAEAFQRQREQKLQERLSAHLRETRQTSCYEGTRVAMTFVAILATIALLVALWPIDRDQISTVLGWLCVAGTLGIWIVWALARAFLDRCDLAVRAAITDD